MQGSMQQHRCVPALMLARLVCRSMSSTNLSTAVCDWMNCTTRSAIDSDSACIKAPHSATYVTWQQSRSSNATFFCRLDC